MANRDIALSGCKLNDAEGSAYATGLYLEALTVLSDITGNTEIAILSVLSTFKLFNGLLILVQRQ